MRGKNCIPDCLWLGDVRGHWDTSTALDAIFGSTNWKHKQSPNQMVGHRPTTSFVMFGPYREAITITKEDGTTVRDIVIKHHRFQFVIATSTHRSFCAMCIPVIHQGPVTKPVELEADRERSGQWCVNSAVGQHIIRLESTSCTTSFSSCHYRHLLLWLSKRRKSKFFNDVEPTSEAASVQGHVISDHVAESW
jgi:hypothetical protein